jgi:hypothetical protein
MTTFNLTLMMNAQIEPNRETWHRIRVIQFESQFEPIPEWVEEGEHLGIEWKKTTNAIYFFNVPEANPGLFHPSKHFPNAIYSDEKFKDIIPEMFITDIYNRRIESYSPGGIKYQESKKKIESLIQS